MRNFLILLIVAFFSIPQLIYSQKEIRLQDATEFSFELLKNQKEGFQAIQKTGSFNITTKKTKEGTFSDIRTSKLMKTFKKGYPNLPVISKLIEIPVGAEINVKILSYDVEIITLDKRGVKNKLAPAQPSRVKTEAQKSDKFYINKKIYKTNKFIGDKLVKIEDHGLMRNTRLGRLQISPLKYNPVANKLKIYNNLKFEVQFKGHDAKKAEKLNKQYSNLYYENIQKKAVNYQVNEGKEVIDNSPVTYVIVSDTMFKKQLHPFIKWKERKGFNVISAYTDEIGNTTAEIKSYLENLYNNPKPTPPSFVLFVGDVDKVPTWGGNTGSHVTDLYYCEYTGDTLPDAYYGRFSAQTKEELQPQIDKTIEYEKYEMSDPGYLSEALLVAGDDETWEDVYGNGAMWYADNYYFNDENEINSHLFLQDPTNGNSAVSDSIFQNINEGVGYANYTAHCSSSGWYKPAFRVSDVDNLSNNGKYGLWVGNCCLSNKFDDKECIGEAALRVENSGAIGYIGGSNNTHWDEDYWWGVGNIASPDEEPAYSETGRGVYDGMFHTKANEVNDPSAWYVTQGQAISCGNLAVDASTSNRKEYYWEVYHLMGDPSLMPYLGVPDPLNVKITPSVLMVGMNSLTIETAPYAYVALSFQGSLMEARHTGENGEVTLSFDSIPATGKASLVVTAQNKQPYIDSVSISKPTQPFVLMDSYSVIDSSGNNDGKVDFGEVISLDVVLKNLSDSSEALNIRDSLSEEDAFISIEDSLQDYGNLKPHSDSLIKGAFSFKVSDSIADQHNVGFLMDITAEDTSGTGYNWQSKFNITVNAPKLEIKNLTIDDKSFGDGDSILEPGEKADLLVTVQNTGHSEVTSLNGSLTSNASDLTINKGSDSSDSLLPSSEVNFTFNVQASETTVVGTKVNLQIDASGGNKSQYVTSANKEIVIGRVPVYLINEVSSVNTCWAYFYDSGDETNNYSNNENDTITFKPGDSGGLIRAVFTNFSIEEDINEGGCYDMLYVYDGPDTDAELIGTFCNDNPPDTITADNQNGALTFKFVSDGSVTKPGWKAKITCVDRNEVKFSVSDGSNPIQDAKINCDGYDLSTNKEGMASLFLKDDSYKYTASKAGHTKVTDTIVVNTDTTIHVTLSSTIYDVGFDIYDSDDTSKYIEAIVTFNDTTKEATNGTCLFENVDSSKYINYKIESKGYSAVVDSIKLKKDTSLSIGLEPKPFDITFYAENESGNALTEVIVEVENFKGKTDKSGYVGFNGVPGGKRVFYAEKEGYSDLEDEIMIYKDSTYKMVLNPLTGVNDIVGEALKVYPNPADDKLFIEKTDVGPISYEIIELTGKILEKGKLRSPLNEINVSSWPEGIYFIRFNMKHKVKEYKLMIR